MPTIGGKEVSPDVFKDFKGTGKGAGTAPPTAPPSTTLDELGTWTDDGGGGGGGGGYAAALAAEAAAKQAGKDQTARENAATNDIVDALIRSLQGFTTGRDTQLSNAGKVFDTSLKGILDQYRAAAKDSDAYAERNSADLDSKFNANVSNLVRESQDSMNSALSQGAGETDILKSMQQAARQFDANQNSTAAAFNDTLRSINSQLAGAGTAAQTGRLNTFQQREEARAAAWNDYYKNALDIWTNVQRTEAANTNIDSDYSTGFSNRYGSDDSVKAIDEITKYAGKTYEIQKPDSGWSAKWEGRRQPIKNEARLGNASAAITLGPVRRAEGATLRRW